MARFVPARRVTSPRSGAERRVLEWLARLDDEWTVIHSLGVLNHPFKQWAEIDVVIIGPPGVITLEVKGGAVRRRNGRWGYEDHDGRVTWKAESPFDQVGHAHAALRETLVAAGAITRSHVTGYAVTTPDVPFDERGPDVIPEVLLDATSGWRDPAGVLDRWCSYWSTRLRTGRSLDRRTIAEVVDVLRGDLELLPTLSLEAETVERELTRLTLEQERIVRAMREDNPRITVLGQAGTGKTMLAMTEAVTLAGEGEHVLYLCHSRPLAERVRTGVRDVSGVTVATPEDLISGSPAPFDAVVVDEAQDLGLDLPDLVNRHLAGGVTDGWWRVFLDPAQALMGNGTDEGSAAMRRVSATTRLTMNCRNTRQIITLASMLARIDLDLSAPVSGPDVYQNWWTDPTEHDDALSGHLTLLTGQLRPESVALITRDLLPEDRLTVIGHSAGVPLRRPGSGGDGAVVCATAAQFKGLEAEAVVVAEVHDLGDLENRRHFYVACSRARVHLSVFLHESLRGHYRRGAAWLGRQLARDQGSASSAAGHCVGVEP